MGPGEADGRWSPATSSAFAERLEMYTAIGGSGEAWGILGEHHVPRFLGWIESALYASSTGTEFPD